MVNVIQKMKHTIKEHLYVSDHFQQTAKKYPNKVAIMFEDRQMTFKEVDEISNKIANMLRSSTNLRHGDTVAIFMENCPEYVLVYLALSKIGVTGAFINHNLRGDALTHCISIANCSALFFLSSLSDAVADVLPNLEMTEGLYYVGPGCTLPQAKDLEELIKNASLNSPPPVARKAATGECSLSIDREEPKSLSLVEFDVKTCFYADKTCYIYTSGTTGLPKACNMKHNR